MQNNKNNLPSDLSPYLQQHKDNPVHWQTWSKETLKFAKLLDYNERIPVVVSGGVSSINDIVAIKKLTQPPELEGVIVGKAIYDGTLSNHNIVNLLT